MSERKKRKKDILRQTKLKESLTNYREFINKKLKKFMVRSTTYIIFHPLNIPTQPNHWFALYVLNNC